MGKVESAVELYRRGCACSQAIVATYGPEAGGEREQALRMACAFGGGMRMAETCGAVSGALMVIGLRHAGRPCDTSAGRKEANAHATDFIARFKERRGSVLCRELLGCDISTLLGAATAREQNLFATVCADIVRDAAELLETDTRQYGA